MHILKKKVIRFLLLQLFFLYHNEFTKEKKLTNIYFSYSTSQPKSEQLTKVALLILYKLFHVCIGLGVVSQQNNNILCMHIL